jgi:hypothetical protein
MAQRAHTAQIVLKLIINRTNSSLRFQVSRYVPFLTLKDLKCPVFFIAKIWSPYTNPTTMHPVVLAVGGARSNERRTITIFVFLKQTFHVGRPTRLSVRHLSKFHTKWSRQRGLVLSIEADVGKQTLATLIQ